jgi:membrane-associated phospholipid phosphatase
MHGLRRTTTSGGRTPSGAAPARRDWRRELGLFLLAYVAYETLRGHSAGVGGVAVSNAAKVIAWQGPLAEQIEAGMRVGATFVPGALFVLGIVYFAAQGLVAPAALVLLWRAHAGAYRLLRTSILIVWAIALPIYALFPTAPPRLVVIGSFGTVSAAKPMTLDTGLARIFYNPYAAVPSLHVAVAVLVGVAFALATRRRWVRLSALAWPLLVTVAVVATGNHYLFDVAAGVVLALVAAALTALVIPGGVRRALGRREENPA